MIRFRNDPLLATARAVLTLVLALLLVVVAGILTGIAAIVVMQDRLLAEFAAQYGAIPQPGQLIWAFEAILALSLVLVGSAIYGSLLLRRIVDSVALGDPFIDENALRLRRMGWLTILAQLVTIPAAMVARWVEEVLKGADLQFGLSLGGVLLTLVLFILARVFARGAAMRDDLEGTV